MKDARGRTATVFKRTAVCLSNVTVVRGFNLTNLEMQSGWSTRSKMPDFANQEASPPIPNMNQKLSWEDLTESENDLPSVGVIFFETSTRGPGMKRRRFSEEQIIGILRQREAGVKMSELCKEHAVSPATIYRWRSRLTGLNSGEAERLRHVEDENQRLKQLVVNLSLDREALRTVLRKGGGPRSTS